MPDQPTSNPKQLIQGAPVLHVADVRETATYYREVVGRGTELSGEPTDRPYHIREFKVRDRNGIDLVFGQDID
jgi:uncharacterized glyoxalase superfamily protein PhnB